MHRARSFGLITALACWGSVLLACGDSGGGSCIDGSEGCACVADQCLTGLSCVSGVCELPGSGSEATSSGDGVADDSGGSTSSSSPDGPMFLSFGVSSPTLERNETLVIAAVLTDPDGVDDLVGGTLLDPDTGGTYGAFATAASEGAYEATVLWEEIINVSLPLTGEGQGVERILRAEFFDVAGNKATRDASVVLTCANEGFGLCESECLNYDADRDNCGGCNNVCFDNASFNVEFSRCATSRCYGDVVFDFLAACGAACDTIGTECAAFPGEDHVGAARDGKGGSLALQTCAEVPPPGFVNVSCSCRL